jgi:hypothetical protein
MPERDGAPALIFAGLAALLLLAFGGDAGKQPLPRQAQGMITVHQQIIIRIPAGPAAAAAPAASLIRWEEHRGPRCIAWSRIAGAGLLGQNSVDLIFRDATRVRARLERRCPALDYYRGFYLAATPDGLICADRDSIRSRTGGECRIDSFRTLRARR